MLDAGAHALVWMIYCRSRPHTQLHPLCRSAMLTPRLLFTASRGLFAKGTVNGRIETLCLCKQHYKSWTAASVCCHTDDGTDKRDILGNVLTIRLNGCLCCVCVCVCIFAPLLPHIPPLRMPRLWASFLAEFSFIYSWTMHYLCFHMQRIPQGSCTLHGSTWERAHAACVKTAGVVVAGLTGVRRLWAVTCAVIQVGKILLK